MAAALVTVLAKLALHEVPPFTFAWLQIGSGGALLTLYTFGIRGERIPRGLSGRVWFYLAWIGVCNFTIVRVVFVLGLERLPATTHAYLVNFVALVTMAMSVVVLRERPSPLQIFGALLALGGLRIYFREIPPPDEMTGVILVGIGVLALASTNNVARKLAIVTENRLSNNVISTIAVWIGGIPVVLAGLTIDWPPAVVGLRNWGIIALNGVVGIAIVLTVFNYVLRTLRSYEASVLAASGVIWTALFAIPILGERLESHQIVGIAVMLAGIVLAQFRRRTESP